MPDPTTRTRQQEIDHIKQHHAAWVALQGYARSVDAYFGEYADAYEREGDSLYECLCRDMEIEPLPLGSVTPPNRTA